MERVSMMGDKYRQMRCDDMLVLLEEVNHNVKNNSIRDPLSLPERTCHREDALAADSRALAPFLTRLHIR
jgi:hypothetical protein